MYDGAFALRNIRSEKPLNSSQYKYAADLVEFGNF